MTLQRCVETVDKIMATGDATIDISLYSMQELSIIRELLDEDNKGILEFFREVQNIDIEKLYLTIKYLDAKEKMENLGLQKKAERNTIMDELIRTLKKYRSLASVIEVVEFCQENIETVEELAEYLQGKEK